MAFPDRYTRTYENRAENRCERKTIQCTEYEIMYLSMVIRYMKICNCKTRLNGVLTAYNRECYNLSEYSVKTRLNGVLMRHGYMYDLCDNNDGNVIRTD